MAIRMAIGGRTSTNDDRRRADRRRQNQRPGASKQMWTAFYDSPEGTEFRNDFYDVPAILTVLSPSLSTCIRTANTRAVGYRRILCARTPGIFARAED